MVFAGAPLVGAAATVGAGALAGSTAAGAAAVGSGVAAGTASAANATAVVERKKIGVRTTRGAFMAVRLYHVLGPGGGAKKRPFGA